MIIQPSTMSGKIKREKMRFIPYFFATSFLAITSVYSQIDFETIKGPEGESMYSVASDNQGILYAGTHDHGIYRSTNNGKSWYQTSLNKGLIYPIYVSPHGKIFAYSHFSQPYYDPDDPRVFTSTDAGNSWQLEIDSVYSKYFGSQLCFSKDQIYCVSYNGLFQSSDEGKSWKKLALIPDSTTRSRYLYPILDVVSDSIVFTNGKSYLLRSADAGNTWTALELPFKTVYQFYRGPDSTIFMSGSTGSFDSLTFKSSFMRSSDLGRTWQKVTIDFLPKRFLVLKDGTVLAGDNGDHRYGIIRSIDSGLTWTTTNLSVGVVNDLCQSPNGNVFVATPSGLYRSTDNGLTWNQCNSGLKQTGILSLFSSPSGMLFAGTEGCGLYSSQNDGTNWEYMSHTGYEIIDGDASDINNIFCIRREKFQELVMDNWGYGIYDIWYAGSGELLRTTNLGVSWIELHDDASDIIHSGDFYYYSNAKHTNRSSNNGITWDSISTLGRAWKFTCTSGGTLFAFARDTILRSRDHGTTWQIVWTGRVFDVGNTGCNSVSITTEQGKFRSDDDGESWTFNPGNEISNWNGQFHELSSRVSIITGNNYWTQISTDCGVTWTQIIPVQREYAFCTTGVLTADGRMIIGSNYGMVRSKVPLQQASFNLPFEFGSLYPNPVTDGYFSLSFRLHADGILSLTVHDILGRKLSTVREDYYVKGSYNEWGNFSGPTGMYFLTLTLNGKSASKIFFLNNNEKK